MSKVGNSGGGGGGDSKNTLYCSFCGKSQHEVRKLIAGPTVFICDECVELCMDIIREENKSSMVKSQEGVGSGQRQFARRGLDRPNDAVKQPRGLRVEPVQRQPSAR